MPYKDPEKRREYRKRWKHAQRAGDGGPPRVSLVPEPVRVRTAQDVLTVLAEQLDAVRADGRLSTCERARTVGYLAGVALRAIEAGDLSVRMEALEAALKARGGSRG